MIDASQLLAGTTNKNLISIIQLMAIYPTVYEFDTLEDFRFD